jgi:ketosteroid isomerase-like protein
MVNIVGSENCGNSPKNLLLRDFNIAVAKGDLTFVDQSLTEDAVWNLFEPAGQKRIAGRENILKEYTENLVIKPEQLVIETVITHGDTGVVNGIIKAQDGRSYVFCDVYHFSSHAKEATIKTMTSYIIEVKIT